MFNAINQVYAITVKELKTLFKDGSVLAVLFVLPIIFVTIMTFAGVGNQGLRPAKVAVVNLDQGELATHIIERLRTEKGLIIVDQINGTVATEKNAEKLLLKRGSDVAFVLVFPRDFSARLTSQNINTRAVIRFIVDPATGGQNLIPYERLTQIQIMNVAGAVAAEREESRILNSKNDSSQQLTKIIDEFNDKIKDIHKNLDNRVDFQQVVPEGWANHRMMTAEEQNVPGYTIFGVFFIVQVIGNTLLREKENGTFNRLLIAPISRSVLLFGKLIPFYFVNILQVIILFAFGHFVFKISLGNSLPLLFAVTLATSAAANALGLFIASISKSAEQMGPLSGIILVTMATLGGVFIPYFEMPTILQNLSFFTPHAWALKGFQDILVRGYSGYVVFPSIIALLMFALLFYFISLFRFRFSN